VISLTIQAADITDAICTVTLMGPHIEAAAEKAFTDFLTKRGYQILSSTEWETPKELCTRLGIRSSHLSQALRHPASPGPQDVTYGPTNRVLYLRSTPALDAFLTKHKKS
jgi:hypothetical protein